jgi:hypothetical protein
VKFTPILCVVALLIFTTVPAQALESLVLYDDFHPPPSFINPDKWFGTDFGGTDAVREIQGTHLRMFYRAFGNTTSDIDLTFSPLQLHFQNPAAVTAIQATITVRDFEVTGCPSNPEASRVRAKLQGFFFNTGTPRPGDATNDVNAQIRLQRRSDSTDVPGLFRVQGVVFQCTDPACNGTITLAFVDLGLASIHQPTTLLLQWDRNNHTFIFKVDGTRTAAPYTVSDTAPPSIQDKVINVQNVVANCIAAPRPVGAVDALFDDVFVNASAALTTSTPSFKHQSVFITDR